MSIEKVINILSKSVDNHIFKFPLKKAWGNPYRNMR